MSVIFDLDKDSVLEFAFGTVTEGKAEWMFGEYFPIMRPIMGDHKVNQLGSFAILAHNYKGTNVVMGSFNNWPSSQNFVNLHEDERFLAIKADRDAAMDILIDGNMFEPMKDAMSFDKDTDYAILIGKENIAQSDMLCSLALKDDSPYQRYAGKHFQCCMWNEEMDQLLAQDDADFELFKIRFNG